MTKYPLYYLRLLIFIQGNIAINLAIAIRYISLPSIFKTYSWYNLEFLNIGFLKKILLRYVEDVALGTMNDAHYPFTHPWVSDQWPISTVRLPRPGCGHCHQMSLICQHRVSLMALVMERGRAQARCPAKPNYFMIHNYRPSIHSIPSLQSQLLLH